MSESLDDCWWAMHDIEGSAGQINRDELLPMWTTIRYFFPQSRDLMGCIRSRSHGELFKAPPQCTLPGVSLNAAVSVPRELELEECRGVGVSFSGAAFAQGTYASLSHGS